MGDWSILGGGQRWETIGALESISAATLITSGGSAHTKGSYGQLTASTLFSSAGMMVFVHSASANNRRFLMDFAVGAPGSEQILIPNLMIQNQQGYLGQSAFFPVAVPAGARVAARCQDDAGSQGVRVGASLLGDPFLPSSPLARVTAYGIDAANSTGTTVDPGAVINTKGSWVQLSAFTTSPMRALVLALGWRSQSAGGRLFLLDVGIGPAGSEKVIFPNLLVCSGSQSGSLFPHQYHGPFSCSIPAGSAVSCRLQSDVATTPRAPDIAIYGID